MFPSCAARLFRVWYVTPRLLQVPQMTKSGTVETDPDVEAVIVGFDRNINYYKLQYATVCLREHPGCQFIATNLDAVTHLTDAQEWAGNGSMVCSLPSNSHLLAGDSEPLMSLDTGPQTCCPSRTQRDRALPALVAGSRRTCRCRSERSRVRASVSQPSLGSPQTSC